MYHSSNLELTIHNIYSLTRAQSDGWSQSHRETRRHIHPETCSNVSSGFSKNGTSFGRPNSKILMFMQYYYVSRNYIKSKTNQLPISVTGDSCPRTTDAQYIDFLKCFGQFEQINWISLLRVSLVVHILFSHHHVSVFHRSPSVYRL